MPTQNVLDHLEHIETNQYKFRSFNKQSYQLLQIRTNQYPSRPLTPQTNPADLEKNHFFVNSEILGGHIWREKGVNYNKFEIATNCVNQIFNLKSFFFFLLTVQHDITILFT